MAPRPRNDKGRFTKAHRDDDTRRPDVRPGALQPTQTIGVGGTAIYGGNIVEIEKDARLTGRNRYKTFSDMLANVSIISSGVRYFLNLVSKPNWKVEPADDSARAQELAETVEEMMDDMATPWHRMIRRAAMYRFYGFSIQEWTAKQREDGLIGMADVEARPQVTVERWDTDRTGRVFGVVQRSPQTQEELPIPREKLVYLVDDSLSDSPDGLGLFRHLVEPAARLRRYEQLEGFGYEGDMRGIPIARGPFAELEKLVKLGTISAATKTAIEKPLRDFIENHVKSPALGIMLDSQPWLTTDERQTPSNTRQWDMELMDGGSYALDEMTTAIQRVNQEMARIMGVEHLLLGGDSAGSFALSRDKSHNFGLIIDSTLKELKKQVDQDWLGPLWKLNGWPDELRPTFRTEQIQYRDIEQVSKVLADMASAGVILDRDDDLVAEMLENLGLSKLQPMMLNDPDADFGDRPPQDKQPPENRGPVEA